MSIPRQGKLSSLTMFALLALSTLIPMSQEAWGKTLPSGHPSLSIVLRAGDDPQFDFFILDENSTETLRDDLDNKIYKILEEFLLPEVRKQFNEKSEIYSRGYIEYVSLSYRVEESGLDILIGKQPEEYECDTEGCAVRSITVEIPDELKPEQVRQFHVFIAVYETPFSEQLAERIQSKALSEARFLLSEASSVLDDKKDHLLSSKIPVEMFFLRQYEDISRVTILFTPYQPGDPATEPIDVVSIENTYYKQAYHRALGEPEASTFEIWPAEQTIVVSNAIGSIEGRICPDPLPRPYRIPVFDPETNAIMDPGSDVQITYFVVSPDGIEEELPELLDPSRNLCSEGITKSLDLKMEGTWYIYATATWISMNDYTMADSSMEIESNQVILSVPSEVLIQECRTLGIDPENCSEITLRQLEPNEAALSDDETSRISEEQNQIDYSMYMIGIGAAIAGIFAFVLLRKADPNGH